MVQSEKKEVVHPESRPLQIKIKIKIEGETQEKTIALSFSGESTEVP